MAPALLLTPKSAASAEVSSLCGAAVMGEDVDMQQAAGDAKEFDLLDNSKPLETEITVDHELNTSPIVTREAHQRIQSQDQDRQYGVLGSILSIHSKDDTYTPNDPRLYINTNAPFSAIVCGVQGAGKSHTVSTILENMFISDISQIGDLKKPLSGLVLYYGEGEPSARPCEAAWLGVSNFPGAEAPKVHVYVSQSSLKRMTSVYSCLGESVTVEALKFNESELDAEAFLSMMAVGSSDGAPLYMQVILSILRDLGENFNYNSFSSMLDEKRKDFNPAQRAGLEQRLSLLNAFMEGRTNWSPKTSATPRFKEGQLTIIDLSDPFVDAASACGLFEVILRLFVRADVGTGKVLVVDEAHKYLSSNRSTTGLTKRLLTLIREQRHLAMRVLISTQEPTVVPPVLLDLCTVAILHRFSSPSWWEHLVHHVSAELSAEGGFDKVVKLKTGEAIVLAPSGLFVDRSGLGEGVLAPLARRYLVIKTRKRITSDGGASILVL